MSLEALHSASANAPAWAVEHKSTNINGVEIFWREAGPRDAPLIILLHGFPSSSRMFMTLLPRLASRFRVIAPDYPGFGHSGAPSPSAFAYTFDNLTRHVALLLDQVGATRYALYLQDYGGPIGFRLATAHPERVAALVIQNAVIHEEGLSAVWESRKAFWQDRVAHEATVREALLSLEVARQRHLAGVMRPALIDPDSWCDEYAFLTRPGMADIQLELMFDYQSNVVAYPGWQAYLREHRPPTLVVWGKNDPLFTVDGAMAFGREQSETETHPLNAGHFALDEEVGTIAWLMHRFLGPRLFALAT